MAEKLNPEVYSETSLEYLYLEQSGLGGINACTKCNSRMEDGYCEMCEDE